jgi:selenocysteine lyase/cysteine desulfurase
MTRPAPAPGYDIARLRREEFPWTERGDTIYLNNASTGPLPARAVRALDEFTALRAEPWRISQELQFDTIARSRALCAALIRAKPEQIALMVNTSYGINLAARALPLQRGDVVLSFDREFPANVYPWMALERQGITFRMLPCVDGLPDEEGLLRALDEPRVRAVSVSWVSFASGYRVDLARIGRACLERGIFFVVDAIQGVGATPLDVRELHVDILACGAQKWLLGPWGSGFVYVREALVRLLEPVAVGWMAVRDSDDFTRLVDYDLTYRSDARRFEVITLPYPDFAGMNASLELLHELGPDAVAAHVQALASRIVDWTLAEGGVRLITPSEPHRRAGIVAVAPLDAPAASERLTRAGIIHSLREGAIRLSPHCFNTADEIDHALAILAGQTRQPVKIR